MLPVPRNIDSYVKQVSAFLREREANIRRGQPQNLQLLDQMTDLDLIKKWSWMSSIVGSLVSFAALPLAAMVLGSFLPVLLNHFVWAVIKVCMGLSCVMFAVAAYFTFFQISDADR